MRFSHEVTVGSSHGREPVVCKTAGEKSRRDDRRIISRCCLSSLQDCKRLSNAAPRARARGYRLPSLRDLNAPKNQTPIFRFNSVFSRSKILHGVGLRPCPSGVACEIASLVFIAEPLRCRYEMMRAPCAHRHCGPTHWLRFLLIEQFHSSLPPGRGKREKCWLFLSKSCGSTTDEHTWQFGATGVTIAGLLKLFPPLSSPTVQHYEAIFCFKTLRSLATNNERRTCFEYSTAFDLCHSPLEPFTTAAHWPGKVINRADRQFHFGDMLVFKRQAHHGGQRRF